MKSKITGYLTRDKGKDRTYVLWKRGAVLERDYIILGRSWIWVSANDRDGTSNHAILSFSDDAFKCLFGRQMLRPGGGPMKVTLDSDSMILRWE